MTKIDLDEAKTWVSETVNMHSHDLINALAHRYQVSHATASSTIKKIESAGIIKRSGPLNRPVFELASNIVVMQSYSLPLQDTEQLWHRDFAPFIFESLSDGQRNLIHDGFIAVAGYAADSPKGTTLHVIAEFSLNNIEMTFQDNGTGIFKQIAQNHPNLTTATALLNAHQKAHQKVHSHRSIAELASRFDYVQIEANGMHFPEDPATDYKDDSKENENDSKENENDDDDYSQGTTVIIGLTLNHDVN